LSLGLAGCVPSSGGWPLAPLEQAYPGLQELPGHRLGDFAPSPWLAGEELLLFSCRWSTRELVGVAIESSASAREQEMVDRALRILSAGTGVQLARVPAGAHSGNAAAPTAPIRLSFVDAPAERDTVDPGPSGTGRAETQCGVAAPFGKVFSGAQLPAQLLSARVSVRRSARDMLGRRQVLSEEEVQGALLHELAHALGFPSHVISEDSLLSSSVGAVQRAGRRALRDQEVDLPSLSALYAIPNGQVLARVGAAPAVLRTALGLARVGRERRWFGPVVRSGEHRALWAWRGGAGQEYVLQMARRGERGRGWSESFLPEPNAAARRVLEAARVLEPVVSVSPGRAR